jgi:hypothetical protein
MKMGAERSNLVLRQATRWPRLFMVGDPRFVKMARPAEMDPGLGLRAREAKCCCETPALVRRRKGEV